jgi:predicted nucleotidyltransferase
VSDIKKNILATLAYFDLFNYPLTIDEILLYLPAKCDPETFENAVMCLVIDRLVYRFDKFYTLKNDYFLIERRIKGNAKAAEMITIAKKVSDLLIRFPYVRGIAISGSLSKNFADENSDIDLFIITAKNKLWLARTIMHCFKKLTFLVKRQHYFCMNYYIDEQDLQIHEKNIYTAIEIATLIPLHGDTVFEQFYNANAWSREYLPNKCMRLTTAKTLKKSIIKSFSEMLLNNQLGNAIDNLMMKITANRWLKKKQMKKLNTRGIVMCLDCGKHYAKPDPRNFQDKLIVKYQNKVSQLLDHWASSVAH